MITLVTGGQRSGKSSFAQSLLNQCQTPTYVATAVAHDDEMSKRIQLHQTQRDSNWQLIEESENLSDVLNHTCDGLLIDCLGMWLNAGLQNLNQWQSFKDQFIESLVIASQQTENKHIVIVSNEVGCGLVPLGAINRQYVDQLGWLNQAVANVAHQVVFMVAGQPLTIKK